MEILSRNSLAGTADVRQSLAVAQSPEFIRWNASQGPNPAWPGKLILNTWTKGAHSLPNALPAVLLQSLRCPDRGLRAQRSGSPT